MRSATYQDLVIERLHLTKKERWRILGTSEKVGYVGVVNFRGPRGRQYRPARTEVHSLLWAAEREVSQIMHKDYKQGAFPTGYDFYAVDHMGRVVA